MKARRIGVLLTVLLMLSVGIGRADVLPSGGGSGAIFTTTPDGSIVNENVHYEGRHFVYLDGGPKQNAPAKAAGLEEGFYVFQVTDPPGKMLLSRDPARCRIVHVNAAGVIDQLMAPTNDDDENWADPDGKTVFDYTGAETDNWADKGPFSHEPCHVPGPDPDSAPGTYAPTPDITGVGRHDTNPDVDHNDVGAIVAQLMPYGLTPNPGGVYKAWLTPIQAYLNVKKADLDNIPSQLPKGKQKPHACFDFCAGADPGFVPSHRYTKTDNFKVTEQFPAEILVRKFHDLNGNGLWDEGEYEIGLDQYVDEYGNLSFSKDEDYGGWPYDWTFPLNGGTKTESFYTPWTHVAGIGGTYSAEEYYFEGTDWRQTASWLDGEYDAPFQKLVEVEVDAIAPGETHEIWFGNTMLGRIYGKKVIDYNADGVIDPEDVCDPADTTNHAGCAGVTVILSGYSNLDGEITPVVAYTDDYGEFSFEGLWPGTYTVAIEDPAGFTCSYPVPCEYSGIVINSGTEVNLDVELEGDASFADWQPGSKSGMKFEDMDGQGDKDEGVDLGLPGWKIHIFGTAGTGAEVDEFAWTDADGNYTFDGIPPGNYNVCEVLFEDEEVDYLDWTQTYPNETYYPEGAVLLDCSQFDDDIIYGPDGYSITLVSGENETGNDFGNFENVDVTVCKEKDADGDIGTTDDRTPKGGWPVYLTVNGERVDTQPTDRITGCYTWEDLPPLQGETSYYDAGEDPQEGWIALVPTYVEFEAPPQSGASYTAIFVNTPTQGCTPGFWQGGSAGGQAGGRWLWNEVEDPEWVASGGQGWNPYIHSTLHNSFFGGGGTQSMWYYVNPDMWSINNDLHKAARSLTAAYLNASWGMAYAYEIDELMDMWATAVANPFDPDVGFLALHTLLDGANNAIGGCPISASGW